MLKSTGGRAAAASDLCAESTRSSHGVPVHLANFFGSNLNSFPRERSSALSWVFAPDSRRNLANSAAFLWFAVKQRLNGVGALGSSRV